MPSRVGYLVSRTILTEPNQIVALWQNLFNLTAFGYQTLLFLEVNSSYNGTATLTAVNTESQQQVGSYSIGLGPNVISLTVSEWNEVPYITFNASELGYMEVRVAVYQDVLPASSFPLPQTGVYSGQVIQSSTVPGTTLSVNS